MAIIAKKQTAGNTANMSAEFNGAMARQIELKPVAELSPYENNARTHSDDQVQKIAASIAQFGFNNPILIDSEQGIIAGHGRYAAAKLLGLPSVPVVVLDHLDDSQRRAYILADNRLALDAGWDEGLLAEELASLGAEGFDLSVMGFSDEELSDVLGERMVDVDGYSRGLPGSQGGEPGQGGRAASEPFEGLTEANEIPEPPANPVTRAGDVWQLGANRVMCGDSTDAGDVSKLMAGERAALIHADPPYGMGKQSDGVANDNLYREKLDAFQMLWWSEFRKHTEDNGSAYIWGNPAELWRLWYRGGLYDSELLEFRNDIVWNKKYGNGMGAAAFNQYPVVSEHCLFFQIGEQYNGNVNSDLYFEGWEEIRGYLAAEGEAAGLTSQKCKEITGVQMYSHWFSKSQWSMIPEKYYQMLSDSLPGHFDKPYQSLKSTYEKLKAENRRHVGEKRSYFDNTHDIMGDTWDFPRVIGDERHGHATPKPVEIMERVMRSSLPEGGLCAEPFAGSGSTLMGAERTGRRCFAMELQEIYCDTTVKRWQSHTGQAATLEATGQTFAEVAAERCPEAAEVF